MINIHALATNPFATTVLGIFCGCGGIETTRAMIMYFICVNMYPKGLLLHFYLKENSVTKTLLYRILSISRCSLQKWGCFIKVATERICTISSSHCTLTWKTKTLKQCSQRCRAYIKPQITVNYLNPCSQLSLSTVTVNWIPFDFGLLVR